MSPFEADNWRQFAMRMAFESNHWRTHPRRAKVVGTVGELIDQFLHNYELDLIGDWDGNQINGRGGRMEERYGRPHLEIAYPCDEFDRMMEDRNILHYREYRNGNCEERQTDFATHVICCIRAGFDVAVSPSGGVVGSTFTVGMIRRMFPEGLPVYVDDFFHGEGTKPDAPHLSTLPNDMMVWL